MNTTQRRALQYVKATNGGASLTDFVGDHEPIGATLWADLFGSGLVQVVNNRVYLTALGEAADGWPRPDPARDGRGVMEPMICKAYQDADGNIVIEALGGAWEGCMSHGSTLAEAFKNFGEAATLYDEVDHD